MAKQRPIGERLKTAVESAFSRQRAFTEEFEHDFDVIQKASIEIAELTSGQEKVAALLKTFTTAMDHLLARQNEAVSMLGAATFNLAEYRDDPRQITEDFGDPATVLANLPFVLTHDPDYIELMLAGGDDLLSLSAFREALGRLPAKRRALLVEMLREGDQ